MAISPQRSKSFCCKSMVIQASRGRSTPELMRSGKHRGTMPHHKHSLSEGLRLQRSTAQQAEGSLATTIRLRRCRISLPSRRSPVCSCSECQSQQATQLRSRKDTSTCTPTHTLNHAHQPWLARLAPQWTLIRRSAGDHQYLWEQGESCAALWLLSSQMDGTTWKRYSSRRSTESVCQSWKQSRGASDEIMHAFWLLSCTICSKLILPLRMSRHHCAPVLGNCSVCCLECSCTAWPEEVKPGRGSWPIEYACSILGVGQSFYSEVTLAPQDGHVGKLVKMRCSPS